MSTRRGATPTSPACRPVRSVHPVCPCPPSPPLPAPCALCARSVRPCPLLRSLRSMRSVRPAISSGSELGGWCCFSQLSVEAATRKNTCCSHHIRSAAYTAWSLSPPVTVQSQQASLARPKATFLTPPWVAVSARSAVERCPPRPRVAGPVAVAPCGFWGQCRGAWGRALGP